MRKSATTMHPKFSVTILLASGFLLRLALSPYFTYSYDMRMWHFWAEALQRTGLSHFYAATPNADYPPLYYYVLSGLGFISQTSGYTADLLFKLPGMFADCGTAFLIYRIALKVRQQRPVLITGLYLFNPVVIMNSAGWGQIDGIGALIVMGCVYAFLNSNVVVLGMLSGLGILFKPQFAILVPVLMVAVFKAGREPLNKLLSLKVLKTQAVYIGILIVTVFVVGAPFVPRITLVPRLIVTQYVHLLREFPLASVNAFNFWTLVGQNLQPDTLLFLGLSERSWGTLFFGIAYGFILLKMLRIKRIGTRTVIFALAAAFTALFILPTRVHERHLLTALPLLALLIYESGAIAVSYVLLSILSTANLFYAWYLFTYRAAPFNDALVIALAGMLTVLGLIVIGAFYNWGETKKR